MVPGGLIGYTVLAGLFATPLAILWFISLCFARRKHDPARVGVAWIKTAFPFWVLNCSLHTIAAGLNILLRMDDNYYYFSGNQIYSLGEAIDHINTTAYFFAHIADICLFIAFVELASGCMLCLSGDGKPASSRRVSRIAILAWSFVLFALAISYFGLSHSLAARYRQSGTVAYRRDLLNLSRLGASIEILKWITSLPLLGLASYVVHKTKKHPTLRSPAILLLVATILDFIRLIVNMAIMIRGTFTDPYGYFTSDAVFDIVQPFFDYVFMFVILVLLFTLAVRKQKGLWSQPQQAWHYPPVMYVPAVMAPPMAPMPGQPQHPMPQQPMPMQPTPGLPAYLQVAQQQQMLQQQQQQQPQQQYYYYPQQVQQPQPVYQQQGVPQQGVPQQGVQQHEVQQQVVEPKPNA